MRNLRPGLSPLLAGNEVDRSEVGENAMDSTGVIQAFDIGGVLSTGYTFTELAPAEQGLLSKFNESDNAEGESANTATVK